MCGTLQKKHFYDPGTEIYVTFRSTFWKPFYYLWLIKVTLPLEGDRTPILLDQE